MRIDEIDCRCHVLFEWLQTYFVDDQKNCNEKYQAHVGWDKEFSVSCFEINLGKVLRCD